MKTNLKERGSVLVMTLGLLALVLMLSLSFAIVTDSNRRSASANSDLIKARILSESGLERTLAAINSQFKDNVYPADNFLNPITPSSWEGRRYLCSVGPDKSGIQNALSVNFNGLKFTPKSELHPNTGWLPISADRFINDSNKNTIIGRMSYLIIDESGKIDPSNSVFQLENAGLDFASKFKPKSDGGLMVDYGRWASISHLVKSLDLTQSQLDILVKSVHPFSSDREIFWRDANDNKKWDVDEDEERLDISELGIGTGIGMDAGAIYNAFVGKNLNSILDDCAWLKEIDNNPWIAQQLALNDIATLRRRAAAQIAVNIVDYADADSVPTKAHINSSGELVGGHSTELGAFNVSGTEQTWGLSEVAVKIKADAWTIPNTGTGYTFIGDLNINPNCSSYSFECTTPTGVITRQTMQDVGASYSYNGIASRVYIKVKSPGLGGTSCVINDVPYQLDTNTAYTFTAPVMHVNIYNTVPSESNINRAMGRFWISINATNLTMVPDPGIPPKETKVVKITPEFKGEVFFPFAINAENPSSVEIDYVVNAETDLGSASIIERKAKLTIDKKVNFGGGTIIYSNDWHTGVVEPEETTQIPFEIVNGSIIPGQACQATVTVLGSAINYGGAYDMPVTIQLKIGNTSVTPWNDWNLVVTGNINDNQNPRTHTFSTNLEPNTSISISSKSWYKTSSSNTGLQNNHWQIYSTRASNPANNYVKVLRNGDTVPQIPAFLDQDGISSYVNAYVENGKIKLNTNQAIYLFEFVSNLSSSAADFQDLVVLVTLSEPTIDPNAIDSETGLPFGTMAYDSSFSVPLVQINKISLKDADGNLLTTIPSTFNNSYLINWVQNGTSTASTSLYASIQAYDVMYTGRAEEDADFSTYWVARPNVSYLNSTDQSTPGVLQGLGYLNAPYSGIYVKNSPFTNIGELGRIHSYQPGRSLRLWSATLNEQTGHDAAIIDLFRTGKDVIKTGKANINSLQPLVLKTVFSKAGYSNPESLANILLATRAAGKPFTNIGEVFGSIHQITGSDPSKDIEEETRIASIADYLTVRQNYFTVIVTAQSIKDVKGTVYTKNGLSVTADYNIFDVQISTGQPEKYIDKVLAESKILAVIYRDGISGQMRIVHYEHLNE